MCESRREPGAGREPREPSGGAAARSVSRLWADEGEADEKGRGKADEGKKDEGKADEKRTFQKLYGTTQGEFGIIRVNMKTMNKFIVFLALRL